MVTSTVVLSGQLIIEGVKFLWWVTDGRPARLTVSHPLHGTKTQTAESNPELQAKVARSKVARDGPQRSASRVSAEAAAESGIL